MRTLAVLGLLLQGCIIYEEQYTDTETEPCFDDCTLTEPQPQPTEPGTTEPTEPQVAAELYLTVNEAEPGQELLTTLESKTGAELTDIQTIQFARDVDVLDAIIRTDEVVLLLAVADEAEAGEVDVFVERSTGEAWILAEPFVIVPASGGGTTCLPTDTGMDDSGAIDTGCP